MTAVFIFISGAALLIYSAEKLVGHLTRAASGLRVSVFLLAVIFTGIEFDDVVLGVALNLEDMHSVALGLVLGTAISYSGVVLALAPIISPTEVRVPRDYVAVFAAAPLVLLVLTLTGPVTAAEGAFLLALFAVFIGYIAVRESRRGTPTFRNEGVYEAGGSSSRLPGWGHLGLAVVALAGLIIGAATTSDGTEGILETYGIGGTVFGATIATAALTVEDVFLTVEPVRSGVPALGIGNVIGSLVFSVTGKLGIIVLTGGRITVGPDVLHWHLPALVALTGLAAVFLATGRLRRWHGYTLLALYAVYWVVSFAAFGGAPIED